MKAKWTLAVSLIFQCSAALIQYGNQAINWAPAEYKHAIAIAIGIAQFVMFIKTSYTNPNGTPATLPYIPDPPPPKPGVGPLAGALLIAVLLPIGGRAQRPNAKLTPGATNPGVTQANIGENVCKKGWSTSSIRPPTGYTNKLKAQQIKQYGYRDTKPADYEEDHLISLEIGGNPTDPKNLWPEPYSLNVGGKQMGARQKDKVEDRLHVLVCSGTLTLAEAQKMISTDWTAAYRKYVGEFPKYAR